MTHLSPTRRSSDLTGADGALMHRAKPVQPLAPGLAGRTAGEAQSLDHRSRVHPPQPGAAGEDRMRYRDREGAAGQRQAVGDQPAAELRQEAIGAGRRSEEHTSELQSLMRISY